MSDAEAKPVKLDAGAAWLRGSNVWQLVVLAVGGTVLGMKFDHRMATVETIMARDAALREKERDSIVQSIGEVRDELRRVFVDAVTVRQFSAWLEMFEALNKGKFPEMTIPRLPR